MQVESVVLGTIKAGRGSALGQATVTVYNETAETVTVSSLVGLGGADTNFIGHAD